MTIPLDPLLSPQTNASKLYKQYNKLKTAEEYLTKLIDKGEAQLDYIASVQDELSRAFTDRDILEIRRELVLSGFLKNREKSQEKEVYHRCARLGQCPAESQIPPTTRQQAQINYLCYP